MNQRSVDGFRNAEQSQDATLQGRKWCDLVSSLLIVSHRVQGDVGKSLQQSFSGRVRCRPFRIAGLKSPQRFSLLAELAVRHEFKQGQHPQGDDQDAHQSCNPLVRTAKLPLLVLFNHIVSSFV